MQHTCPTCKGSKEIEIIVHMDGKADTCKIDCVDCDGTGKVDDDGLLEIDFEKNMWCTCKKSDDNIIFYDDGEHPEISKHHYRHGACGKVVQIG
jgi:hypothetical protein